MGGSWGGISVVLHIRVKLQINKSEKINHDCTHFQTFFSKSETNLKFWILYILLQLGENMALNIFNKIGQLIPEIMLLNILTGNISIRILNTQVLNTYRFISWIVTLICWFIVQVSISKFSYIPVKLVSWGHVSHHIVHCQLDHMQHLLLGIVKDIRIIYLPARSMGMFLE